MNTQDYKRSKILAELDLDYHELKNDFQALSILAAKVADTELSEVNFIDNYTQWTVAGSSGEFNQKPREKAICNFTIDEADHFKIRLDLDENFKETDYVKVDRYKLYYGIPLKINGDITIGSLCVAGKNIEDLNESQIEQLHLIAKQIEKQIQLKQNILLAQKQALEERKLKRRLAHDVRSPLSGIAQLVELTDHSLQHHEEIIKVVDLIAASTTSILQLVEDILLEDPADLKRDKEFVFYTLASLAQKLSDLYQPQAQAKQIDFQLETESNDLKFSRTNLLPIIGNLISNALKFTKKGGHVLLEMKIINKEHEPQLYIQVSDTGIGMSAQQIEEVLHKKAAHRKSTSGQLGFGMGLVFVKQLCEDLDAGFNIESSKNKGTQITLTIPLNQ